MLSEASTLNCEEGEAFVFYKWPFFPELTYVFKIIIEEFDFLIENDNAISKTVNFITF